MKRILSLLILGIFVISLISSTSVVLAKEGPPMPPKVISGMENGSENDNSDKDVNIQIQSSNNQKGLLRAGFRAKNVSQVRNRIREQKQIMNQSLENYSGEMRQMHRNKNQVRIAVHSLLAMENLTGGIGKNVSQVAREFNNSIKSQIEKEERIRNRGAFMRMFAGGDLEAASELAEEANKTKSRIRELKRLREECNCTADVKQLMQEQIQEMEQEQERINQLAKKEKSSKGLFGWIWK